jgi:hypothetical protein
MIADLKPYAKYKESGSRWLAHVPLHQEALSLRTPEEISADILAPEEETEGGFSPRS